jgi:catechol 2,3-dioxygenase-like lactoylglutathione lyase family enzyme
MIARRVDHVSFAVRDLGRSLAFYRDVLGLEPIARPDLGVPGAWLRAGDAQVHLIEVPADFDAGTPPPALNPLAGHAAFAIDDYAAALATLERHGLEVLALGASAGQMWVKDPDGHVIELIAVQR